MATNNAVDVGLSGQTGTGNFVGSTSPTLTTPVITTITTASSSIVFDINTPPSPDNYITLQPNVSGGNVGFVASGTDADIGIYLQAKGSDFVSLQSANSTTGCVIFNGTGYQHQTVLSFANTAAARTITFPDIDGTLILDTSDVGQNVSLDLNTATPNNRSLRITTSNAVTTITSGFQSSCSGVTTIVGASDGDITGTAGSIVSTGTLSGTSVLSSVLAEIDLTGATVNAGTIAAFYGKMGGTAPTQTDMTNTHGIVFTNGTTAVLNSQLFVEGDAQYFTEINNATTYVSTPVTGIATGPFRALKVSINGADYFILAATSYA